MKIAKLYTYPIKALRAVELSESKLTRLGFPYDRRFMLLEAVHRDDGSVDYKTVHVAHYPKAVLFFPKLEFQDEDDPTTGEIIVTYRPADDEERTISVPLMPGTDDLDTVDIAMYKSGTTAYIMNQKFNEWFSSCFDLDMVLIYLGDNLRPVRMSTNAQSPPSGSTGWMTSISSLTSTARGLIVGKNADERPPPQITFSDCAPYLIASERSMDDLHHRLGSGIRMDITKFRPNIIVAGAAESWEEDLWAELTINGDTRIDCVHNCGRCKSINIDYETGAPGTTEAGSMLKKMQRDRRVDPGMKYSPIFGRYSFLNPCSEGHSIRVGDEVEISRVNTARTVFDWDGLCTLAA